MPKSPVSSSHYFSNRTCPYFPCHEGADPNNFNCLFCYCPLYPLGLECGGTFSLLPQGGKDCSQCLYPHQVEHYEAMVTQLSELCSQFPPPEKTTKKS